MSQSGSSTRATCALLKKLLVGNPSYRQRWCDHAGRISGELNQAAVARVIQHHLWDIGESGDDTVDARSLKDLVSRVFSGSLLTATTLTWFTDAFEITESDRELLWETFFSEKRLRGEISLALWQRREQSREEWWVGFWDGLTELDRRDLRRVGTVRTYSDGTVLFHEGDSSDAVIVILRGSVKVITNSSGGYRRLLAVRGCGDVIGEVSGIWRTPRSATVQAADRVEVLTIPRTAFVRVLERSPNAALELIRVLGQRRRHADHERTEFNGSTVAQRVSAALVELATHYPADSNGAIALPVTQEELASLAATSRSGVARALVVLRRQGVVVTMPRQIVVTDVARLRVSHEAAATADLR